MNEVTLQVVFLQNKIWAKPVNRVHLDMIFIVIKINSKNTMPKKKQNKNFQKKQDKYKVKNKKPSK